MSFDLLGIAVTIGIALLGWVEMRLTALRKELSEQIVNKQQVDAVVQESIKEDLLRLEKKIDDLTEKLFKLKTNVL
jgi:hypothetical protein